MWRVLSVALMRLHQLVAVHARHHDVGDDEVREVGLRVLPAVQSVDGRGTLCPKRASILLM